LVRKGTVSTLHASESQAAPEGRPFTLFEARGINFAIVVYSQCMHIECRFALSQLFGITEGNMAKKAKTAKAAKKTAKKTSKGKKK
jgi:hypothetical protein